MAEAVDTWRDGVLVSLGLRVLGCCEKLGGVLCDVKVAACWSENGSDPD